ncbi:hypothetical protein [Ranid herpesvirus 3]|uniref:Uncharacterized protein n=1 Tax=Ranid herpesvirus 3 TaxID=1987509 RepID=A0A1X9T5D3_9VIRU|nr:hypothetical protein [Ranid herpesvirus 3]ARR28914.1 hypothetical protein [Ranid herpesvirus 3]
MTKARDKTACALPILLNTDWKTTTTLDYVLVQACTYLTNKRETTAQSRKTLAMERSIVPSYLGSPQIAVSVGSLFPMSAPLICLTRDNFYNEMRSIFTDDIMFQKQVSNVVSERNMKRAITSACVRATDNLVPPLVVQALEEEYGPALNCYVFELYKNYLLWYLLMGCVPYIYTHISTVYDHREQYHLIPLQESSSFYDSQKLAHVIERDDILKCKIFRRLSKAKNGHSLLKDTDFYVKMGMKNSLACVFAHHFMEHPTDLNHNQIFDFIVLLRSLNKGFVPYIPSFVNKTDMIYDPTTGNAVASDHTLLLYEVMVCTEVPPESPPASMGAMNNVHSKAFRSNYTSLMSSAQLSGERVAVVANQGIDMLTQVKIQEKLSSIDKNATAAPLNLRANTAPTANPAMAQAAAVAAVAAPAPAAANLSVSNTSSIMNLSVPNQLYYTARSTVHPLHVVTANTTLGRVFQKEDEKIIHNYIDGLTQEATLKNRMLELIHAVIYNKPVDAMILDIMPNEVKYALNLLYDSLHNKELPSEPSVHLVESKPNTKILCQFDRLNPWNGLTSCFYLWSVFWKSIITGAVDFKSKNTIEYNNASRSGVSSVDTTPTYNIIVLWEKLLHRCGFMFGIASDTGVYLPTNECFMVAKVLHERDRSVYLAKQLKVDPQCINPKSSVLMEDSRGRRPEDSFYRDCNLTKKRKREDGVTVDPETKSSRDKKINLTRTNQLAAARKENR